ncbi:hypothetical protein AVEN_219232-1 [Araneus ventricosus]|uniref:Uncharacterized protein n=1 Tax=Araneus ventricosus TaxID=182803 RepID=A0A4Y2HQ08_ARAVE|nr:hypothetical protein AVEN_219232-1 [Araneus ventricosus]
MNSRCSENQREACAIVRLVPLLGINGGRWVSNTKLDSTGDPPGMCTLNLTSGGGSLERGCQLRSRPGHLTMVKNYEVRPKVTLVLPRNRT